MRSLPVLLLLTLPVACSSEGTKAAPSPSATAPSKVQVLSDCEHLAVRPSEILIACGDGSYRLTNIRYSAWNDTSARGTATAVANDFTPNRATGNDHPYAVTFVLDRPTRSAGGLYFARVSVQYKDANPYGQPTDTWPLTP